MISIVGNSANELFVGACRGIVAQNDEMTVAPRGRPTMESIGARLELRNPLDRLVTVRERALSPVKVYGRLIWELCGRDDLASIAYYDDQALRFAGRDGIIATAYGTRLMAQMPNILAVLKKDPDSRRAIGVVLDPSRDDVMTRLEYPCAVSTQYLLRDGDLHCVTCMRSQSVWGVLPYDIALFTLFQEYVAHELGVGLGSYVHFMGSAHVYAGELDKINAMLLANDCPASSPMSPFFDNLPSLVFLGEAEARVRETGTLASFDRLKVDAFGRSGWATALSLLDEHAAKSAAGKG